MVENALRVNFISQVVFFPIVKPMLHVHQRTSGKQRRSRKENPLLILLKITTVNADPQTVPSRMPRVLCLGIGGEVLVNTYHGLLQELPQGLFLP